MKKYILIALMSVFALQGFAQKKVYWIHGLGENSQFWQRYKNDISGIYAGAEINWAQKQTIPAIATEMNKSVTTNAVLIGHSTGGLVARSAQQSNAKVKAIVTVGTPNQGAGIVKSMNNKTYYNVIDEVGYKSQRALDKSLSAAGKCAPPITWTIAPLTTTARFVLAIATPFAKSTARKYADRYASAYSSDATVKDMAPGSSYLNTLNGKYINVPIVNLYGAEDYWPVVRMAGSYTYRDYVVSMANTGDTTYDETQFATVRSIQANIYSVCSYHDKVYDALMWPAIIMPWIWGTREYVKSAENEWKSVDRYVEYDLHNNYSQLIGAVHCETQTYYTGWWIFKKKHTRTVAIYESHDGLIANKDSQIPTNKGVNVKNVSIKGVNHMEMSGHKLMKIELQKIHDANGYDRAFNPRNL